MQSDFDLQEDKCRRPRCHCSTSCRNNRQKSLANRRNLYLIPSLTTCSSVVAAAVADPLNHTATKVPIHQNSPQPLSIPSKLTFLCLHYSHWLLSDRAQHYNDDIAILIAKMANGLEIHLKSLIFDDPNSTRFPSFLPAFQMACESGWVQKGSRLWLLKFLWRKRTEPPWLIHISFQVKGAR